MRSDLGDGATPVPRRGLPVAWAALGVLVVVLSAVQKLPCLRGRVDTDTLATAQCYSDVPIFYLDRALAADVGWLGRLQPGFRNLEYPPLINLFIEATAKLTHVVAGVTPRELDRRAGLSTAELYDLPGMAAEERTFFLVTCAGLLLAVLGTIWIAWRGGWVLGDRASWLMLAPIVLLTVTLNWDVLAVVGTAGALLAWQRARPAVFGALVAVGTATKLFPLVLLAAGLILVLKHRQVRQAVAMVTAFALVTIAANAPLYLSNPEAWAEFWSTSADRPAGFGSAWFALRMVGVPFTADQLSLVLGGGMVAAWLLLGLLTWRRIISPTLAELAVVFLLVFLTLGKVFSPQYSLWVVLGVLLVTRSRWLTGIVAAAETFHYVATWLYIRGITTPETGIDRTYWASMVLRLAAEALVVVVVLTTTRRRAAQETSSRAPVNVDA